MCRKIFVLFIESLPLLIKQIGPNLITPDFARSARVSETTPASGNRRDRWRPPCTHCVSDGNIKSVRTQNTIYKCSKNEIIQRLHDEPGCTRSQIKNILDIQITIQK